MSELREIMQRLSSRHSLSPPKPAGGPAAPPPPLFSQELEVCSDAMLQYEWAWLARHREGLELCRSNATMLEAAGGSQHLETLIQQAEVYHAQLEELFTRRGLAPKPQQHSVADSEHAWELSHPGLRAQWGIELP